MNDDAAQANLSGTQGWREFLAGKQELLGEYQLARRRSLSRPIKSEKGEVAEAVLRRWLAAFLPGRYGVTSGYVVSCGLSDKRFLRHYDVIIYDKVNSPVLWRAGHPDRSELGTSLALPVEFVHAVFEVKSTLTDRSVRAAAGKLHELAPLLSAVDEPDDPYPIYLPQSFACGAIFFQTDPSARGRHLTPLAHLGATLGRGFMGGVILSVDADPNDDLAARLVLLASAGAAPEHNPEADRRISDGRFSSSDNVAVPRGALAVGVDWSIDEFGFFAHDLVAMLAGKFQLGQYSSKHGIAHPPSESALSFPLDELDEDAEGTRKNEPWWH